MAVTWTLFGSFSSVVDVKRFLNQEHGIVSRLVQVCCFIPNRTVMFRLGVLCYGRLFRLSSSGGCLVFLQMGLQSPLGLPNVFYAAAAGDL